MFPDDNISVLYMLYRCQHVVKMYFNTNEFLVHLLLDYHMLYIFEPPAKQFHQSVPSDLPAPPTNPKAHPKSILTVTHCSGHAS